MTEQPARRGVIRGTLITLGVIAVGALGWTAFKPKPTPKPVVSRPQQVTALGRLMPEGGLVPLSIPAGTAGGNEVVQQWFAGEGDPIRKGQALVRLSSFQELQAAVVQAQSKLQSTGALLPFLKISQSRGKELFQGGAISEEELAKTTASILEKQADVEGARASLVQAQSQLKAAEVRSPLDGRLIRIYSWPGMKESEEGLAVVGRTGSMQAWVQVFQTDVERLRIGQKASITAETGGFPGKVQGTLKSIIGKVSERDLFAVAANNDVNARVVLVKLDLEPSPDLQLDRLSGLNVTARFEP